ncbi:MAG: flotillin domain-containing protein, partial [Pseudomonadota bacterium]
VCYSDPLGRGGVCFGLGLADAARAKAVAAEEQVATARESEIAERTKKIELIEAAKEAERDAISIKVEAEAEKDAATNRAEASRLEAKGEADAEILRAEADRVRFEVEAAGQQAVNEAANILSMEQISLQTKLALLKVLPEVVRESAKPMEAIDSIKIVQVDGLTNGGTKGSSGGAANDGGGSGNLANDAVSAALAYRAQAPVLDGLMKELGLDGSSLGGLAEAAAQDPAAVEEALAKLSFDNDPPASEDPDLPKDEAAE